MKSSNFINKIDFFPGLRIISSIFIIEDFGIVGKGIFLTVTTLWHSDRKKLLIKKGRLFNAKKAILIQTNLAFNSSYWPCAYHWILIPMLYLGNLLSSDLIVITSQEYGRCVRIGSSGMLCCRFSVLASGSHRSQLHQAPAGSDSNSYHLRAGLSIDILCA